MLNLFKKNLCFNRVDVYIKCVHLRYTKRNSYWIDRGGIRFGGKPRPKSIERLFARAVLVLVRDRSPFAVKKRPVKINGAKNTIIWNRLWRQRETRPLGMINWSPKMRLYIYLASLHE